MIHLCHTNKLLVAFFAFQNGHTGCSQSHGPTCSSGCCTKTKFGYSLTLLIAPDRLGAISLQILKHTNYHWQRRKENNFSQLARPRSHDHFVADWSPIFLRSVGYLYQSCRRLDDHGCATVGNLLATVPNHSATDPPFIADLWRTVGN